MRIITNIIVRFGFTILPLLLFIFGVAWSLSMVLRTPAPLEQALKQSGIYGSIVQNTVEEKQQETQTTLPLDRPEIQTALQEAFSPQLLETKTNQALASTYDWVQGKTDALSIHADLSSARTTFAQSVREYVITRTAGLPVCSLAELRTMSSGSIDPYNATCRPATLSPEVAGETAYQEVLTNQTLGNSVFTTDSIKNSSGEPLSTQLEVVPRVYRWMHYALYGSGIVALVIIASIVALRRTVWRQTTKQLGGVLFTVGLLSAGLAWLIGFGFDTAASAIAKSAQSEFLQAKIVFIVNQLAADLQRWWLGYGICLMVIAIILWIIRRVIRKKPHSEVSSANSSNGLPPIAPRDTNVGIS